jgi:hypothetical protein
MKAIIWIISLVICHSAAQAQIDFSNFREDESRFLESKKSKELIKSTVQKLGSEKIKNAYLETMKEFTPQNLCGSTVVSAIDKKLQDSDRKSLTGALYYLREQNLIDDIVLHSLILHAKAYQFKIKTQITDDLSENVLFTDEKEKKALAILATFSQDERSKRCLDAEFKVVRSQIVQLDKKLTNNDLRVLIYKAHLEGLLSFEKMTLLLKANEAELHKLPITLVDYFKKVSTVKRNLEGLKIDKSKYITDVPKGSKISRRELLYQKYDYIQMLTLANIIKTFKKFEDPKYHASFILYQETETDRVIEAEYKTLPMDKFRGLLQILIQQMDELKAKETFSDVNVTYEDLISASYEVGYVVGEEVEAVAKLQDIWNPKKTFWEKASVWVRLAATASAVIIPPPYGFIPTLALVVIEATTKKSKGLEERPHTIF